jgi:hypothetical protein
MFIFEYSLWFYYGEQAIIKKKVYQYSNLWKNIHSLIIKIKLKITQKKNKIKK